MPVPLERLLHVALLLAGVHNSAQTHWTQELDPSPTASQLRIIDLIQPAPTELCRQTVHGKPTVCKSNVKLPCKCKPNGTLPADLFGATVTVGETQLEARCAATAHIHMWPGSVLTVRVLPADLGSRRTIHPSHLAVHTAKL